MDILDTTSHANAIITDLVKIAEKKGATEGSTPKTIAAGINLITNTLSGNEEAKSPVIVRALDELVNAVGSGGGGSSDFSTANVAVIKNTSQEFVLSIPNIFDNTLYSTIDFEDFESGDVLQVPLYKGSVNNIIADNGLHITGVGNVIKGPEGDVIGITGDCTITIS